MFLVSRYPSASLVRIAAINLAAEPFAALLSSASTASAFKFAEEVAKSLELPEEEDGFAYIEAVHAKTGVPIPPGLRDLKQKEVRHEKTVSVEEMEGAVREALSK